MKYNNIITAVLLAVLFACDRLPKNLEKFIVDVSEFTINDSILKDGDYVRVLGASGNLKGEYEIDFYNLVVVKSMKTGDTINVLATNYHSPDVKSEKIQFVSNQSMIGKLFDNHNNLEVLENANINDLKPKTYNKVFYDTEYIRVDVRKYPAITGLLANYTVTENGEPIKDK